MQIFAEEWRPETEPRALVCLVHGLGEHGGRYVNLATSLCQNGYSLVVAHLRGHGQSQGQRGHAPSYNALLDDVGHLLYQAAHRCGNRPLFLYGHSLGGNLVLNYILRRHPHVTGVIATSPWLRLVAEPYAKVQLARAISKLWPSLSHANGLDIQALSHDPRVVDAYKNDPLVHDRISARLFTDARQAGLWALHHSPEFVPPLLLMHGSADSITSSDATRQFADRMPGNCTLKVWQGMYHEIHNEPQYRDVINFLTTWLQTHI